MTVTGSLDIAVAQPAGAHQDLDLNARRHAEAIRAARARVVVFPEMSLTGYHFAAHPVDRSDPRLSSIIEACAATGALALVGAPVHAPGGGVSIGMLAIDGEAAEVVYRKIWLGDDEIMHYVPGTEPRVIQVDGWRLGLAICKDTGIESHAAATAGLGIDVYVAGVLEHADDRDVQPARAARVTSTHGVWFAVASFAGSTGEGFIAAAGESAIWRPDGTPAARAGTGVGEFVVATLDGEG